MAAIRFKAKVTGEGMAKGWHFVSLPKAASAKLPSRGIVKIVGTINGLAIRTSVQPDGKGSHIMMLNKAIKSATGLDLGKTATLAIEPDTKKRVVKVPPDVKKAIAGSDAATELWKDLTPRCHEEWLNWITEAKKAETRERRIGKMIEKLESGVRRATE